MIQKRKSFTLIELLLSMALLALLSTLLIGNYMATLKRGKDQQRKNDISQVQKALEAYYEDMHTYPTTNVFSSDKLCTPGTCAVVYMQKMPKDPSSSYTYRYESDGTSYYLYSYLENTLDQGGGVNMKGYEPSNEMCDTAKTTLRCRYYIGSSNAVPLTPIP